MENYKHYVQYYETDRMGITHHSNYIRWMEEARVDFLSKIGWDYARLEEMGVISPVLSLDCKYKSSTTFADTIEIRVRVKELKGIRLKLSYSMHNQEGKLVCEASSEHCFLNAEGKPIRINKTHPEFYAAMLEWVE